MVTTRSSSKTSRDDPKKHATTSGRVEKPKKATNKAKMKEEKPMTPEECEAESELMRQISLGEASLPECHHRPHFRQGSPD